MAILLVSVEPVCSLYIYFLKDGYSDEAVDPIRQRKTAVNSLQQLYFLKTPLHWSKHPASKLVLNMYQVSPTSLIPLLTNPIQSDPVLQYGVWKVGGSLDMATSPALIRSLRFFFLLAHIDSFVAHRNGQNWTMKRDKTFPNVVKDHEMTVEESGNGERKWWIRKNEIWNEELVDGYQKVSYRPGAFIWGGQLSGSVSNPF